MLGIESILNIVTSVAVLAVVAVGLYIVFGLMQVINMAHGDMVMLGAYVTLLLTQNGINFWLAAIVATIAVGLVGALIERSIIKFVYKSGNLSTMLATWGVSICLQQGIKLIFGPQGQFVDAPVMPMTNILGVAYPTYRIILLGICLLVLILVFLILQRTRMGLLVRATMDDPVIAETMGINTKHVYMFGFIFGSALAGLAGALIAPITSVSPLMGVDYVTKAFLVVIAGGVDSMFSTIGGSIIIAGLQNLLNNFIDATNSWLTVLLIVVMVLWVRPKGVFSKK